ncbi:Ger(x)C family spore germination protein [Clostridium sp.]|uniref:Ger(x)C family spore germination protein n=2 Tax=Clostridium sp. TaxID=1506 RepID=UPI0025C5274E|nr:Ger(x)C family spore germination protein [Clostridium sp.]MCI1715443.1 Ger(x)C family spore germination protein [Clostridium sp.]MCI1799766.1 Ger(x)C family spore germination protein [Clostridium sp.]MCI1813626.1 Ger(x)C family spore germination protein [Clostridium sp.]MCI1870583.1 Ger(x)C family spore germination protein [Clostridium sp.]MCI2200782.1 Ger(x)C family spore germination protein [Clostridium sp.]
MKKNKILIIIPLLCMICAFFMVGIKNADAVENLEIVAGIGSDIEYNTPNLVSYSIPLSTYIFGDTGEDGENTRISSTIRKGVGKTIGETRENRQSISDKKSILGFEKVYVISESNAVYGIEPIIDVLFKNPQLNDTGYFVICKGKAEDMLSHKVKGYPSSSDFIEGLMKNEFNYSFFPKNTKITDLYTSLYVEGVNPVIPYIEICDGKIKVSGMALFKDANMVAKSNPDDSKWLNLMRNDRSFGIVSLQKSSKNYADFYADSSRKISVDRIDGKLHFTIELKLKGNTITNTYFKDLSKNVNTRELFEKEIGEIVHKNCCLVINKMKMEYKTDCIGLGQYAAAKYGRWSNTDWNKEVLDSSIDVNVKVSVENCGRGSFQK